MDTIGMRGRKGQKGATSIKGAKMIVIPSAHMAEYYVSLQNFLDS